ncbi:MAG: hypothetical protein V2I24_16910 [Halieaceae bacterium]|jgi:hypothetical protein|nr:hypothetical protein [Halieaceae bacterium]
MVDGPDNTHEEPISEEQRLHHEIVRQLREVTAHIARVENKSQRDATESMLLFSLIVASTDLELEMSDMRAYVELLIDRMLWQASGAGTQH